MGAMPTGKTIEKDVSRLKWVMTRKDNYIRKLEKLIETECECRCKDSYWKSKNRKEPNHE